MTVIATDGKTIAADSLRILGGQYRLIMGESKIVVHDGANGKFILATSGLSGVNEHVARWINDGAAPEKVPPGDWDAIVIRGDGVVSGVANECPYLIPLRIPFAIGAGSDFAIGAMLAGASPAHAIEVAIKASIKCAPPVTVFDIAAVLSRVVPILMAAE